MKWYSGSGAHRVKVNVASKQAFLNDIKDRLRNGRGFSVATLNLDHVVKLRGSSDFRAAYEAHTHVTADGNPIVWLMRLAKDPVELIPGSELLDPICEIAADMSVPVGFLGSNQQTLDTVETALQQRYPKLKIVVKIAPPMGFDPVGPTAETAIADLAKAGAQLVFLALGAPKQELFAAKAAEQMPHAGFLSIGAGLDFIAGSQVRAPQIVRRLALEWLWRLLHSPKRLAWRYVQCFAILPSLVWRAVRRG